LTSPRLFTMGPPGQYRRYHVGGNFRKGISEIDRVRIYLNIGEARLHSQKTSGASFIQVICLIQTARRTPSTRNCVGYSAKLGRRAKVLAGDVSGDADLVGHHGRGLHASSRLGHVQHARLNIVPGKDQGLAILRSMGYTSEDISSIFSAGRSGADHRHGDRMLLALSSTTSSRRVVPITGISKRSIF